MMTKEQYRKMNERNTGRMRVESAMINMEKEELENASLSEIKGIWPWTIKTLSENWIKSVSQLRAAWEDDIKKIITNPIALKGVINFLQTK